MTPPPGRPAVARWRLAVPVVAVVAVAGVLVGVRASGGADASTGPAAGPPTALVLPTTTAAADALVAAATAVPPTAANAIGTGGVVTVPIAVNGRPVTADGRPRIVWVAGEDCAPCAAMGWALLVAAGRFGAVDGVGFTATSGASGYPGTTGPVLDDATVDTDRLAFTFSGSRPAAADRALLARYDAPPYVTDDNPRPFLLVAGLYVSAGSLFSPAVLAGLDPAGVTAALSDPASAAGRAVVGAANILTAAFCAATDDQPGGVCGSPAVRAAKDLLGERSG